MTARSTDAGAPGADAGGWRLPRAVEGDPRAALVMHGLASRGQPLWAGGAVSVPRGRLSTDLAQVLRAEFAAGRVVRGLEGTGKALAAQERGLDQADARTGSPRGQRVSRLLLLADDGSERFYRGVESLMRRHRPRVLAVRLDVDAARLGSVLFGDGQVARVVMLAHKESVSAALLAISRQWEHADS